MDDYIREMFEMYSSATSFEDKLQAAILFSTFDFKVFERNGNSHYNNELYRRYLIFYEVVKETKDIRKARIEAGLNFKEAKHIIDILNFEHEKRLGIIFYEGEIKERAKRRKRNIVSDEDFENFLNSIDTDGI